MQTRMAEVPSTIGVTRSNGRVLVVDDDQEVREALCDVLEDEGYDVSRASNGAEALRLLSTGRANPDAIVLDLTMPVMDGYEFLARRNRDPRLVGVPVVVVSATIDARVHSPGVELVRKPVDLDDLLALVDRQVRRRVA